MKLSIILLFIYDKTPPLHSKPKSHHYLIHTTSRTPTLCHDILHPPPFGTLYLPSINAFTNTPIRSFTIIISAALNTPRVNSGPMP